MPRKLRVKLITIPWELDVPALSLASLAAVTPESHFDVSIVDVLRERLFFDEPTDLVGITASTPSINAAYALADVYRSLGVKVVLGGHHVTALPEEGLKHADAVVCGEGEGSWMRILDEMLSSPSKVGGIYRDLAPDLSTLPPPRTDLMKMGRYQPFYYPIMASRGCPMGCSFCFAKRMTHGYRTYPIANVLEQIRRRPSWVQALYFVDDNLAGDIEYTRELFRQLKRYNVHFGIQVRHEFSHNPDDIRLAAEAGCALISSGFESVNQHSLDRTGKQANAALYKEIVTNIQREGVIAAANWMFGFDWDTPDIFQETWEFLHDSNILHSSFTTEIPFPGTPSFRQYEREGRILSYDYDDYVGKDRVIVRPKQMTPEQLRDGIRWLSLRYYSIAHRQRLTRITTRDAHFFPQFKGPWRTPLLTTLQYYQAFQYTYRMKPALRWLFWKGQQLNKHIYVGDLMRGTNFWHPRYRQAEPGPASPLEGESPFLHRSGAMPPKGDTLTPGDLIQISRRNRQHK